MKGLRVRFKPGHILAAGAALALMLAACAPAVSSTSTSIAPEGTLSSTESFGATSAPSEAVGTESLSTSSANGTSAATEASTSSAVGTSAATEVSTSSANGTSAATEASTTVANGTSAATEMSTSAATSSANSTSEATSAATANPNATAAGTETANQPLLIQSDKLLGMALYDTTGNSLGQISDVLVDITGTVQGVVVNLSGTAAGTPAATSAATSAATTSASTQAVGTAAVGTQTTGNAVIVPFSDLKADVTNQKLTYQGSATALPSLPAFDATKFNNGYVLRTTGTNLPAQYEGLIRLGAQLNDMKLQTSTNDKVGSLQNVILDLNSGKATYAAVDVSSFVGATNDVVLVPWSMFKLDQTDTTSMTPIVRLNVNKTGLQSAPKFDPSTLSFWPTPAQPNWDNQIKLFWQTAGF